MVTPRKGPPQPSAAEIKRLRDELELKRAYKHKATGVHRRIKTREDDVELEPEKRPTRSERGE